MPVMHFRIHWPDGVEANCYSPSTVVSEYFAMGDSRDNSLDSRYWGFVPRENIFARALYVHLSFDPQAKMGGRFPRIRFSRIGKAVK